MCCSPRTDQGGVGRFPNTETGRTWSGHFRHAHQQRHFLRSAAYWLSGRKQTVPRAELWGAIQILSRVDGKTNIQIPIDAKYVTRGIAYRGDLVQGPNGDLWSILFQLIHERSGVTDFIKVKSHLEDAGPSVIKQNKIALHHILANFVADVVAEEAAKRLLPDLNLERKAKWAERVGVGVAKRLALVQADIWAKRREAGDIYELDPLVVEEATCTRTVFSTLLDELAHQGHLLVRHNKGLRCKVFNVYRSYRQFRFWSRHPCVPRPNAAAFISQFKNKKRQLINTSAGNSCHILDQSGERNKTSSKHDEKELYHCTSLGYRDIQRTHSHPEHFPLLVALEPELDLAHTHQCCDYSLSQTAEQSGESHHVLTKTAWLWHGGHRGGELPPSRTLVNPELHNGQISTTQKDGTSPFPRRNALNGTWYSAWSLLLAAKSSCVVFLVVLGLVRYLWWKMGTKLGRSQLHVKLVGRFFSARALLCQTPHLPCLDGRVWFPGTTHRAIKPYQKVWMQSWRTARSLIRLGTKCWVNSLGVKWKQHCRPLWAPVRPASRCRLSSGFVATSEHAVISGWSAGSFSPCAKHTAR